MWKDFFYYSKSERRAVYVLLVLLLLFSVGIVLAPERKSQVSSSDAAIDSLDLKSFSAKGTRKEKTDSNLTVTAGVTVSLSNFDPNLADSIELLRLGLPPYVVRNTLNYRKAGGRFVTPESFSRIYGLTEEKFEELKPYIQIARVFNAKSPSKAKDTVARREVKKVAYEKPFKYPEGTLVDVNVADTAELKKVPGIGSVIARAIVAYRERLGGFYSLEQLMEVKYVTPELMKWFTLGASSMRPLRVNKESLDRLRAHPYLNFYQAKVIVEHRRKKGEIKNLSQLSLYEEFAEKDLERLSAYFSFD